MPELPEVESLRRGLLVKLRGQKIKKVSVSKPKLVSGKGNIRVASAHKRTEFIRELQGEVIKDISRRAKNLIFHFRSGKILLVHLKMSGQFIYREKGVNAVIGGHPIEISEKILPNKHSHIIFELTRGTLYYNDTRMFGYLLYYPDLKYFDRAGHFNTLGLEPLTKDFTLIEFEKRLKTKTGKLKTVLMNQSVVTGLGNIYCDEVCFRARTKPTRLISTLKSHEIKEIHQAIKYILPRAIALGGSSVASYRLADGSRGNYAREHKVYGRAGEKCARCGQILNKIILNGRTTVFCNNCQK